MYNVSVVCLLSVTLFFPHCNDFINNKKVFDCNKIENHIEINELRELLALKHYIACSVHRKSIVYAGNERYSFVQVYMKKFMFILVIENRLEISKYLFAL